MSTPKQQLVREILSEFPSAQTKVLARIAYERAPELFTTLESARSAVRYARGNSGSKHRQQLATKEYLKENDAPGNPFGDLPEPVELEDTTPYELRARKVLVISDVHIPYHDRGALELALMDGKDEGVTAIVINGDFADFFAVSRWEKDPRERNLARELDMVRETLALIRREFTGVQIVMNLGNHEERWESYLFSKAPELVGCEDFEIEKILRLDQLNITVLDRMRHVQLGHLSILHGHEFGSSFFSPVNPARGLFLRAKTTAMCGHYHQTSEHAEPNLNGTVLATWSTGCLCHLRPRYRPYGRWNLGYAMIDRTDDDGGFRVHNRKIIAGKVY